jgi:hypothetical protein
MYRKLLLITKQCGFCRDVDLYFPQHSLGLLIGQELQFYNSRYSRLSTEEDTGIKQFNIDLRMLLLQGFSLSTAWVHQDWL